MSHRIVYDQVAVCFPRARLQAAHDHWSFHQDLFLFFELGGDNNLYVERHAGGRRSSLRARSWSLTAIGAEWEVMRQLVGYAAACEGGGMRFSGSSDTNAETYIRHCRAIMGNAVVTNGDGSFPLGCVVTLEVTPDPSSSWRSAETAKLRELVMPTYADGRDHWHLDPLRKWDHAAALFAYNALDPRPIYRKACVNGSEYEPTPLLRRLRSRSERTV